MTREQFVKEMMKLGGKHEISYSSKQRAVFVKQAEKLVEDYCEIVRRKAYFKGFDKNKI